MSMGDGTRINSTSVAYSISIFIQIKFAYYVSNMTPQVNVTHTSFQPSAKVFEKGPSWGTRYLSAPYLSFDIAVSIVSIVSIDLITTFTLQHNINQKPDWKKYVNCRYRFRL